MPSGARQPQPLDGQTIPGIEQASAFGTWVATVKQQHGIAAAERWLAEFASGYLSLIEDSKRSIG